MTGSDIYPRMHPIGKERRYLKQNMRDVQIALEKANMKQTSMRGFMDGLDANKSCDVLIDMSSKVVTGIIDLHEKTERKRSPFFKLTEDLDYENVAYIGLRGLIGNLTMSSSMAATKIATNVGDALLIANGREEEVFAIDEKTVKDKVAAGLVLLRVVISSLPDDFFRVTLERLSKTNTQCTVLVNKGFQTILEENEDIFLMFTKKMMPLVCTPDSWEGVYGGGYLTESSKKLTPLIKRNIKHDPPEGSTVLDAINHLQKTPFRVNQKIFELMGKLQGIRPSEMKKVFMKKLKKFDEPCPIDKDADSYIWEKVEDKKLDQKTGKMKKAMVMLYQDDESIKKRKDFFKWAARKDHHKRKQEAKKSLDRSYTNCLELTNEISEYEEVFWAYCLDRRSRVYPSAMTGINIQGSDYQKAVVEFSVGLPLDFDGDGEGGVFAIIKTVCNHWGNDSGNGVKTDKLTMSASKKWIKTATDWMLKCADDPLENRQWMKADKPLQFLAAVYEWAGWLEYRETNSDYGFVSHLCDPNDASCSGAQILSAMTRDRVGALHTNLLDTDVQDLYMAVAERVTQNLMEIWDTDELAQDWLGRCNILEAILRVSNGESDEVLGDESVSLIQELTEAGNSAEDVFLKVFKQLTDVERSRYTLIVRNLVKKPVMVKFYSGTRYGNIEHCNEYIVENGWEDFYRCDGTGKAAAYMGNLIYDSINQVIAGAGRVMEWFVHVADVLGNLNLPVKWTTPIGFKASMKKFAMKNVQLKVKFRGDDFNKFTLKIPKTKKEKDENGNVVYELDVAKMKSGIAPDIVHSLDASLIMSVSERCAREGIDYLCMIHDSLGSHCCFSSRFNRIIREQFVEMFTQDILGNLYEEFKSQIPVDQQNLLLSPTQFGIVYGDYDLKEMLSSFFCFK